jgi:hypothetical protein
MALHPDFPRSPYEILNPEERWFPAAEELRETAREKLLPPLVEHIREEVARWRESSYQGTSATSRALLEWWFKTDHLIEHADGTQNQFRYYFAQREAVESVIWLYDVRRARDKFDLMRFDASGAVSASMFDEAWPRFVVKMAPPPPPRPPPLPPRPLLPRRPPEPEDFRRFGGPSFEGGGGKMSVSSAITDLLPYVTPDELHRPIRRRRW